MLQDTFTDAIDGAVTAELVDNGDCEHIIVNLMTNGDGIGIALTAETAEAMARALLTLAAGLESPEDDEYRHFFGESRYSGSVV